MITEGSVVLLLPVSPTAIRLAIGLVAIEYGPGTTAAETRVSLVPACRRAPLVGHLVRAVVDLARELGAPLAWLSAPATANWATTPTREQGFRSFRARHLMLRSAGAAPLLAPPVAGVHIRPLQEGEELALLAALNRAWAGTWNFRPITAEVLLRDLRGQRAGLLLAVGATAPGRIVGTLHARFDPTGRNPDGAPYTWISNLTTDPAWRGRRPARPLSVGRVRHDQLDRRLGTVDRGRASAPATGDAASDPGLLYHASRRLSTRHRGLQAA